MRAVLALFAVLPAGAVYPCHVPDTLRHAKGLTAGQRALLSAGHAAAMTKIPYKLVQATPCVGGRADIFPCRGVDLLGHLPLDEIGGGNGNDLWGWVDPANGREIALVGRSNGTAFVDVTDPERPIYLGNLPTHADIAAWRDIKVYRNHAFVVADFAGDHGMQVFDLRQLRQVANPPVTFAATAHHDGFTRAHNIAINEETGFAYAVGLAPEDCLGGLYMMDVRTPAAPRFVGCYSEDGYTHDAQCVVYRGPDAEHRGREVCFASNEDSVTLVDVTDKDAPFMLSRTAYDELGYVHQGWLTPDHRFFLQDDEGDESRFGLAGTRTYMWDMSDLDQPRIAIRYEANGSSIDHNQYVRGRFAYQANYRRGLRILQIPPTANGQVREVGAFDTFPESDGNGFDGAWSVYPYFSGGKVLISDINRGLFIVRAATGGADGCVEPPGSGRFCSACGPCAEGEGDCDSDAECGAGLSCTADVGAQFGFAPRVDVCTVSGGACAAIPGSGRFCTDCGPCGEGEGDCDSDTECRTGLSCTQNVGAQFGFAPGVDVCTAGGTGIACSFVPGNGRFCTECGPCAEGEGDCDTDAECAAGLVCTDNVGAQFGFAPGVDVCTAGGGACPFALGSGRFCTECGPCAAGEGDCDADAECLPGLVCTDNVGAQFGFAPGVDVCTDG